MSDIIVGEFKITGINDIDKVIKKWNHLYMITEWRIDNSFRLIKYLRKDSPITTLRVIISEHDAKLLIEKLGLKYSNYGFNSGFTWKLNQ